jgi:peptidoglycan hydrolase-like protein with peptidoglycan-binding domain
VDGEFGTDTKAATRTFQERFGLEVDGVVGPSSRKTMKRELEAKPKLDPVVAVPPWPGRLINPGATGADVRQWQAQMSKLGWDLAVDGEYGSRSEGACRELQGQRALEVDGIVGLQTWKATFEPAQG